MAGRCSQQGGGWQAPRDAHDAPFSLAALTSASCAVLRARKALGRQPAVRRARRARQRKLSGSGAPARPHPRPYTHARLRARGARCGGHLLVAVEVITPRAGPGRRHGRGAAAARLREARPPAGRRARVATVAEHRARRCTRAR